MKGILNPATRRWAYGVCIAICGVLAVKGFIDENMLSALSVLFAAVFGLAYGNVNESDE